jgi:uncharacterized membrane protein YidH (DUF202 family)
MFDPTEGQNTGRRSALWMFLASIGIVAIAGFIAGFMAQHQRSGDAVYKGAAIAALAAAVLAIIGLGYWTWRNASAQKVHGEDLTRRERLNRYILAGCIGLGGIMGLGIALAEDDGGPAGMSMFSNSPLPTSFALAFAFVLVAIVPAITWYWHRYAVDEMEESAYREGTYYAFYAYAIGAPLWWILWRGGLVSAPDGIVIYYITIMVCGVVWMWKKYR